jgi:hypothetical protein
MKQLFLAATLLVAITSAAFADGKKANAKLLSDLNTALKSVNESAWQTTEHYKKTTFTVNGTNTSAYVDTETGNLLGFGIAINEDALPAGTKENIAKKYQGWQVINSIMFIEASGNIAYYTQVIKGKNNLALRVSPKGNLSIYERIPKQG